MTKREISKRIFLFFTLCIWLLTLIYIIFFWSNAQITPTISGGVLITHPSFVSVIFFMLFSPFFSFPFLLILQEKLIPPANFMELATETREMKVFLGLAAFFLFLLLIFGYPVVNGFQTMHLSPKAQNTIHSGFKQFSFQGSDILTWRLEVRRSGKSHRLMLEFDLSKPPEFKYLTFANEHDRHLAFEIPTPFYQTLEDQHARIFPDLAKFLPAPSKRILH
jgi:hypothetical protein